MNGLDLLGVTMIRTPLPAARSFALAAAAPRTVTPNRTLQPTATAPMIRVPAALRAPVAPAAPAAPTDAAPAPMAAPAAGPTDDGGDYDEYEAEGEEDSDEGDDLLDPEDAYDDDFDGEMPNYIADENQDDPASLVGGWSWSQFGRGAAGALSSAGDALIHAGQPGAPAQPAQASGAPGQTGPTVADYDMMTHGASEIISRATGGGAPKTAAAEVARIEQQRAVEARAADEAARRKRTLVYAVAGVAGVFGLGGLVYAVTR